MPAGRSKGSPRGIGNVHGTNAKTSEDSVFLPGTPPTVESGVLGRTGCGGRIYRTGQHTVAGNLRIS